ncbi:replication factor C subunit 2 isoform X1 [Selaginella moellendorffii]|uniref:replication factor C subunit 2 isoform X1 n=1 Tax=Selaginella moellendorffii TaxID=88036 RepID=UPI000D1C8CB7|nr:replication factor C subunit 2 isoform X1 [Selaginella moellendorffii]|eukprot:XP_024515474.1 replication factor C subunit 2 isoform X1 [Selaginella moellendorffii]
MAPSQQWVEKYRPKQVKDVAHQDEVVRTLANALETGNLPHLLFYGPPGTGKTSTALAVTRELFGPQLYKTRVLELNASDDRGINVVRTKIKDFAAVAVGRGVRYFAFFWTNEFIPLLMRPRRCFYSDYPCPPFKVIILDEADSMTEDAQNALRRTMETYSKVTRFCFICNYISRIIEPLASRCAKFRFKSLNQDVMHGRILHICSEEGVQMGSEALATLSRVSEGDLRRAITYLQSATRLYGSSITSKDILSVSGVIPDNVIQSLLQACTSGVFDQAQKEVTNIIAEGYPVSQIFSQVYDHVVESPEISDEQKAKICQRLAEADKCLLDGADESLQLMDVCSNTMRALCNMTQECSYV